MKTLSIIMGKLASFVLGIFKRGGATPGQVALKIDKNLLKKFKYSKIKIAITGSSGKGSTAALLAETLRENGYSVCFNSNGSNLKNGFTSACLKYSSLSGKIKSDIMVIEIDEKFTKEIFKYFKPDYLIVTNITKDQPPRQHNVDITYSEIVSALPKNTTIVTMMDEPFLRNFELQLPNKVIYYGINKNKFSYKNQIFENLNTYYCPKCHHRLTYEYYNFETLGKYKCETCDFKWNKPYVLGDKLDLENEIIYINNKEINIGGDMLFFSYNTLASYTMASLLNIKEEDLVKSINEVNKKHSYSKNINFTCDNILYKELKVKAEDAPTFNQAVFKIYQDNRKKDVIIGLHKISGRYTYEDVSWMYDITFELINNDSLNKIYLLGGFTSDFKKRLVLAGIKENKIIESDDLQTVRSLIKKDKVEVCYGLINYDYLDTFASVYKEEGK